MSRTQLPRAYCGAPPPKGRTTADGFALWCAAHAPAGSWPLVLSDQSEASR